MMITRTFNLYHCNSNLMRDTEHRSKKHLQLSPFLPVNGFRCWPLSANLPAVHSRGNRAAFVMRKAPAIAEEEAGGCCSCGARSAGRVNWKRFAVGAALAGPDVEGNSDGDCFSSIVFSETNSPPEAERDEGSRPPSAFRSVTTARPTRRPCWRSIRLTSTCNRPALPSATGAVAREEKGPASFPGPGFGPGGRGGSQSHAILARPALISNGALESGERKGASVPGAGEEGNLPNLCR